MLEHSVNSQAKERQPGLFLVGKVSSFDSEPAPPNSTRGFESFDLIESDSSFHRAKLAQGDEGIDSGQ